MTSRRCEKMNESANGTEVLNAVARILLWCFGLGLASILLWFGLLVLMGDFVYSWHAKFFQISREHFEALHYLGLMLTKAAIFELFLFPYVGIRIVLRMRTQ
jgi:hypothetical protein